MLVVLDERLAREQERAELKEKVLTKLSQGPVTGLNYKQLITECGLNPAEVSTTLFRRVIGCLAQNCSKHGPARIYVSRAQPERLSSYEDRPYTLGMRA